MPLTSSQNSPGPGKKQKQDPHSIFMKLSTLEMKKKISLQERGKVARRIEKIDERIKAIDSAIADLLLSLNLGLPADKDKGPAAGPVSGALLMTESAESTRKKTQRAGRKQFTVRY